MLLYASRTFFIDFHSPTVGLFVPPAFANITYKTFIIFGVLCFGAAVQAFFTYPETCGKTLEEIEIMFSKGGPRPWNTRPGGSRLEAEIQAVINRKAGGADHYASGMEVGGDEEKAVHRNTEGPLVNQASV